MLPREFVLYSDHEALNYLQSKSKLKSKHAKCIKDLQDFTFMLKHKPGVENKVTDALSHKIALLHYMNVSVTGFEHLPEAYPTCLDFEEFISRFRIIA